MAWNRSLLCGRRQSRWTIERDRERKEWKKKENKARESGSLQLPDRAVIADARNRRNPHLWNEYTGPAIPFNCGWTSGHSNINGRLFWNESMCRFYVQSRNISKNFRQYLKTKSNARNYRLNERNSISMLLYIRRMQFKKSCFKYTKYNSQEKFLTIFS